MIKKRKIQVINNYISLFKKYKIVILLKNIKTKVRDILTLKTYIDTKNSKLLSIKNTLIKIAIQNQKHKMLIKYLKGVNILILSNEIFNISQQITKFCTDYDCVKINIGYINNLLLEKRIIKKIAIAKNINTFKYEILKIIKIVFYKYIKIIKFINYKYNKIIK